MIENRFARRAAGLSAAFAKAHCPSELDPGVILFDSGFAAPQVLPDLTEFAQAALTEYRQEALQYSPTHGQVQLRQWLAELMNADGCSLSPDDILVVNGAKHGLDLTCRLLLDEGDAVVVTAPTYFTAIPIFRSFGIEFVEVSQDREGLDVAELETILRERKRRGLTHPKLVYNVPEFHNPTGVSMSLERRRALSQLAAAEGLYIVEDSPYRRLRFEGETLPLLKAGDRTGSVIHLGTFSKLVSPGLRIGWIAADRSLIARLIQLKSDGGSSPLAQRILFQFVRSPKFREHVDKVRRVYRQRRDCMIAALAREIPEGRLHAPSGGYYIWLTLPVGVDGEDLAARSSELRVRLIPGSRFFASEPSRRKPCHQVRLSYSYATPEQIEQGVERLAAAFRSIAGR